MIRAAVYHRIVKRTKNNEFLEIDFYGCYPATAWMADYERIFVIFYLNICQIKFQNLTFI